MNGTAETLTASAAAVGVRLDGAQVSKFLRYLELLLQWNVRAGLTSLTEPTDIILLHFVDSLLALKTQMAPKATLLDVGSGAGFPGIPIKIVRPDLVVSLLESSSRKVAFLDRVAGELDLGLRIRRGRAESAGHDAGWREAFSMVTARAVAHLAVACELTLPFVHVGGKSVLLKGPRVTEELAAASRAASALGGGPLELIRDRLPDGETRVVVVIPKVGATPPAYPRRAGLPERKPLGVPRAGRRSA